MRMTTTELVAWLRRFDSEAGFFACSECTADNCACSATTMAADEIERLREALVIARGVIKFYSDRGVIADENAAQALAIADAAISSN